MDVRKSRVVGGRLVAERETACCCVQLPLGERFMLGE
jgi:hypothetical protein